MLYFERPFVTISWNDDIHCVESDWFDFSFGAPYREAVDKGLELLQKMKGSRSLSDLRRASVLTEEDAKWVVASWLPRASEAGLRKIAVIPPSTVLAQMQIAQLQKKGGREQTAHLGIVTEYFESVESARRWIASDDPERPKTRVCSDEGLFKG
jgi:hypothetical protein